MPYTPPSHRSPASSASSSPDVSRRSSIASGQRPSLPRSASYLNKHRRTPSAASVSDAGHTPSPPYSASDEPKNVAVNGSVRKSPPPVTEDRGIPNGAIISPPDSASSGSEDEGRPEIRGRKLGKLRDAVSQIPQARTPSPNQESTDKAPTTPPRSIMRTSFSTTALNGLPKSGRRIGHVRSATDPNVSSIMTSTENSQTVSEDSDEDLKYKPQMVRKKSGELVRPALRPPHRRPSSMPGTPVFTKAVHFDSHLEHVRHFLQVDRPLAVSAGSSPVESYESDTEYPFPGGENKGTSPRSPPFEWELVTNNFPHDAAARRDLPVRLEKLWLSSDQKSMLGSVAVSNLSFHKAVVCRFTLDYWKTTSEVVAEYSHEIRPRETPIGQDRFTFSIKLSDTTNLESKTLFFCVRYNVNGQEYWDSNNGANFQVDFRKKHKPQNGKNNFQGATSRPLNGLPRSNRRQNPSTAPRPASMPASLGEFGNKNKFSFDHPIHDYLGETGLPGGLRLKTKSTSNLASDNVTNSLTSPIGVAFANRYDFGASLNATIQATKESVGKEKDALYMKRNVRSSPVFGMSSGSPTHVAGQSVAVAPPPNTGLPSSSYEELVSKYCFFNSKQSNPAAKNGSTRNEYDGFKREVVPIIASPTPRHAGPAAHHGLHLKDLKPLLPSPMGYNTSSAASSLKTLPSPAAGRDQLSTPKTSMRSQPPSLSVTTTPHNDMPLHMKQQVLPERFPWGGEAHTATAIRG